ncbi:uncharacterized protein [Amphiura filiformis]|uniref:uncharacterized protein n=1 Tax=Amphiura filiformis TaxID=82378 RepID=UPI003B21D1D7
MSDIAEPATHVCIQSCSLNADTGSFLGPIVKIVSVFCDLTLSIVFGDLVLSAIRSSTYFHRLYLEEVAPQKGANLSNLRQLPQTPSRGIPHERPRSDFPTFTLTNAQSIVNKFDEFELLLDQEHIDVGVVTESWFHKDLPDTMLSIEGYELFTKSRNQKRGGGVAIYVKSNIAASKIQEIAVPDELECLWVLLKPKRLPRDVSVIAVCGVYIPRDSPHRDLLDQHLLESMDFLHTKYPEIGFTIMGDFNRMNVNNVLKNCNLKQLVTFPTRGEATLDLIMTNISSHFKDPIPVSALGKSDHICIIWRPTVLHIAKHCNDKRTHRPMKDSQIREFGLWIQGHDWSNVLTASTTQLKANALYRSLHDAIDSHFPLATLKVHSNNKPWMTQKIKSLVKDRQKAFAAHDVERYKMLRNKVQRAIKKSKVDYYANRVRNLQATEPRKWHQQIRSMTRNTKSELSIPISGVSDDDHGTIANTINDQFVSISSNIPPLDLGSLEAYLPAPDQSPSLYPWDVYAELKKVKSTKASGPDALTLKVLCPLNGKRAIVVPIPKSKPPRADKLRPISLTDCFSKISEGFITDWVLEDIQEKIDPQQYGNIKGISTSHYLVSLLHSIHQGADKVNNIGTVVLTDFSKAFDMIDHNILISKFIRLGVRRSIVPWLCDFVSNRVQCVRYNQTLSEYRVLNGALPQGTKLGPIGFQVVINDAAQNMESDIKCWKYVDDLTLAENRSHPQPSKLQEELTKFNDWTNTNKLSLNPPSVKPSRSASKQTLLLILI